jgi:hypothetical protein
MYIPEEHRLRDTTGGGGYPVMTFAPILKYNRPPLAPLLCDLLSLGKLGMGCDVEFEYSLNLHAEPDRPADFYILQMRPMAAGQEHTDVHVSDVDIADAVCYSTQCLGNGIVTRIQDIVYVPTDRFDAAATRAIADEIGACNAQLRGEGRPYLLIGPGRWGSADRWLGIPVRRKDIDSAGAVIEVRNDQLKADASHGSHFFQHLTSQGIVYMTITEGTEDFIRWQWMDDHPAGGAWNRIRSIRLDAPLRIKADGRHGHGAVLAGDPGSD